jgi:hypothetical protein
MRAGIHSIISMMLTLCLGLNASALSEIVNQAIDPIPKLELSPRQDHALSGTVFASSIESMKLVQREEAILGEISEGNIPNFLRELVAVETSITIENTRFNLTFFVTPDYLSIGSDADHLLIPMTPMLAQRVVDQLGGIMPTRKMVDLIWNASDVKLPPQPIPPSPEMVTISIFQEHSSMVEVSRSNFISKHPPGRLVSGHKKDVILSNQIASKLDKVFIYGWHYKNGEPIQPLYGGHVNWYVDYSHGIRFISNQCLVNGSVMKLTHILKDPLLSQIISDELGAMETIRYDTSRSNYP